MKYKLQITEDGSYTVFNPLYKETYHSVYGARTESLKIFIEYGLNYFKEKSKSNFINIFEVGFGSGLNAFLTHKYSNIIDTIQYNTIELHKLNSDIFNNIAENFQEIQDKELFLNIHRCNWNESVAIANNFSLKKIHGSLIDYIKIPDNIDVVYFDAFSPNVQPELWTIDVFSHIYEKMNPFAVLTTYCAKGQVRRNLQDAGFVVERLEGPPHKREVLRAIKIQNQ